MKRAMRMISHKDDALNPVEVNITIMVIPIAIGTMWQLKNKL
jgi:hypothetical protein